LPETVSVKMRFASAEDKPKTAKTENAFK
jgi:hypothetical protein